MKNNKMHACDHIGIFTNNAERLVYFYSRVLGFAYVKEEILANTMTKAIFGVSAACRFIRLSSGSVMLEIFEPLTINLRRKINKSIGLNHWGYCVIDRKKYIEQLKRKRAKIIEIKRNNHVVYFIKDPDDNRIEIRDLKK